MAQSGCDTIVWSATKKLQPSDFRDVADTGRRMIAFTMTKFAYKAFPQDESVIINTATLFYPCSSWLNRANLPGSILHEQIHFDITEYYKRLFLKRIGETQSSADVFATTTRAIFRDISEQRKAMNIEYDQQTANGSDPQEQVRWSRKITDLLASLEKYSINTITINLK